MFAAPAFAQHPARPEIVAEQKSLLQAQGVDLSGACGAFKITQAVAWRLQADGVGLLEKSGGNNCQGYAVDVLTYQDGSGVDILTDAGGDNGTGWTLAEPPGALLGRWRAPIPPTTPIPAPPAPVPQPTPYPGYDADLVQRLMRVENNQLIANLKLDAIQATGLDTHAKVEELRSTAGQIGLFIVKYVIPPLTAALATWQVTKD